MPEESNIKDLSAQCVPLFIQLGKESLKYIAFARLRRDKVPEMADFCLANAVDPTESLLEAVRIPRQVIIIATQ